MYATYVFQIHVASILVPRLCRNISNL